jgi:hypothetical protein
LNRSDRPPDDPEPSGGWFTCSSIEASSATLILRYAISAKRNKAFAECSALCGARNDALQFPVQRPLGFQQFILTLKPQENPSLMPK